MGDYYLAIDMGASGGRHILGRVEKGALVLEEVHRFANGPVKTPGAPGTGVESLVWDDEAIFREMTAGLAACARAGKAPRSVGIDTWGVDYALVDQRGAVIKPVYAYRDARTEPFAHHAAVPFEELYRVTGIAAQPFNTVYQLLADKAAGRLDRAAQILQLPEYFSARLCGRIGAGAGGAGKDHSEYTMASTTGLLDARSRDWSPELLDRLGLPRDLFKPARLPPYAVGPLSPAVLAESGLAETGLAKAGVATQVTMVASHDTASAVAVVEPGSLYISSGTWSLLGVTGGPILTDEAREAGYTNEGACNGKTRFLKNIMGLWLLQNLHKELGLSYAEMEALSRESAFTQTFDVNDKRFLSPADMRREIIDALGGRPLADKDVISSVYHSLAKSYAAALTELERNTGRKYDTLYIAGGGAKDKRLASLTERYTGKKVVREPVEAAALGNLKIQLQALEETDGAL